MSDFQSFPLPFWLVVAAIVFFAVRSWRQAESALRLPMLMVLFTVTVWYVGDVLYNDYVWYRMEIDDICLEHAWWEVLGFVCSFGLLTPLIHRILNRKYLGRPSNLLSLIYYGGLKSEKFQRQLDIACWFLCILWAALMIIALIRTDFDFQGLFMPYLGKKTDPWARGRIGTGFDSLLALGNYFQIGFAAVFGVIAALAYRPSTFGVALTIWLLTLPSYIFDWTRSFILATFLPGFLAWLFLRLRSGVLVKAAILTTGFLVIESWMKFIIANRTELTISAAFYQTVTTGQKTGISEAKHLGLDMFEELGFINLYIADGSYQPNWGEEYLAQLANPIPRSLWPDKPLIGIDYAIARGQKLDNSIEGSAGVGATLSTGMIGQGVVNFGTVFGPLASALLTSLWVAILARQDLLAADPRRMFLYIMGLILTFNMGRDITLLVLYPFCFGYILLLVAKYWPVADALRPPADREMDAAS